MTATKRKTAEEARRQLKRIHLSEPAGMLPPPHYGCGIQPLTLSGQDEIHDSDANCDDSSSVVDEMVCSDDELHATPLTPFSPASSKYPSELKTHLCPYSGCDKAFNRPARLTEHIRSHTNDRIFACTYEGCEKSFLRASHLNHHIKSAHTLIRDYVCEREGCGKAFATGSRLRRHLAAHEGRDKYTCTEIAEGSGKQCGESFRKHSTLLKHVMTVHLKKRPFPCQATLDSGETCTAAFDTAGHLKAHERRVHGEARFTCTECIGNAENEEGTGEGKAWCERSFTKKGNLNVHVKTVHEGEKRFACGETDLSTSKKVGGWNGMDACGKRYGSKLALEEHVRTAHMGFRNARAERKARAGTLTATNTLESGSKRTGPSNVALLTGQGYTEESGNRHIPCLLAECEHRFYRDYDLWLHMDAKHGMDENEIQLLFMQRAMQGGNESFDRPSFQYEMDTIGMGVDEIGATTTGGGGSSGLIDDLEGRYTYLRPDASVDEIMASHDDVQERGEDDRSGGLGDLVDPLLTYTCLES
ncbi:C2H2 transcription factor (TFIIIA), putative [Trichophyton benhamiae CBS 112371]|uniref:C2H2 transcription factor (TFIIIA), putative n=1 Tax=Arthroderma benhamiae (strain ATCC MYA-4681 / CBS 112371) TaxID=663331 RepID=D4AK09_ARTBC|nr:C2H2 transcription factor (TFIIIA), putative [Trichophyton benhamiae CBS 112371]EFE37082.1 C2H2 transcription factor (TFIIIA), putative [Trichophyton benhamiae CBS 112371]